MRAGVFAPGQRGEGRVAPVSLHQATTIVDASLRRARETDCLPLTVVVLDPGGHVVCLQRQDGSGILRVEIAIGKAYGALGMGLSSRVLAERADNQPRFFAALGSLAGGGRLLPAAGGVLVRHGDDLVGAVGVSGDVSDKDEVCAVAGIEAAGLRAETGA